MTAFQYRVLTETADCLLNTLGLFADDYMRHRLNRDEKAADKTKRSAAVQHAACCAAVADVSYWSDLDDSEHAETIARLRETLHADEWALGLGSASAVNAA